METCTQIPREMPKNEHLFQDEFFNRFELRHAPNPIQLEPGIEKNYLFPTFYADAVNAIAIFLCDYEAAAALMPHPKMKPVRMPGGRALITFSAYQYRNVMNVNPYNELVWTIPVIFDGPWSLPVLPMVAGGLFPGFGFWVVGMPVTSRENQLRGNKIWGLPKVTQAIDIVERDGHLVSSAREATGETYVEFEVPLTGGKPTAFDTSMSLYSRKDGTFLQSDTTLKGSFRVTKFMDLLFKRNKPSPRQYLRLGNTPSAQVLRDLKIEPHPFQFRYTDRLNAAFDLAKKEIRS
ncbi:MAG: acetoacetate decarboxylase family protein [Bdellovibrionales bacterium]|nr:acetoacetate decarboxylase family protein [Bdellovibrionales bacterium]